ncbi:MAG: dihydrolipoyl dehydrogenase [Bacteroidaceae bacterium]|nr:dihydrolipoyl dehydrogenase [Bacteroidaceae bacterium]
MGRMRLLIIGGGPGGYETAVEAAKRDMEVTLITEGPLGGTCLNEGCIPTKTFCHYAGLIEQNLKAGIDCKPDFRMVAERKQAVVEQLRGGIDMLLRNVQVVRGKAVFKDSGTVLCNGQEYSADKIIIATGSVSASLPIPGAENCITSKEILELSEVPRSLCVIGGGVIGLEFASIFRSFGTEVTVLEFCPNILPRFDTDLAKRLRQSLSRRGISIEVQAQVTGIDGNTVTYMKKDKEFTVQADKVLMAVGRRPYTEGLNLEAAGIDYTRKGITVDDRFETSVPGIYAVGDVTGGIMLAHAATFQGLHALNHICGREDGIRFDLIPAAVFTMPEVASVGLTEEQCKERGLQVRSLKSFYRANGKAVSMDEPDGYCKLIVAGDGTIIGAHIMGAHSSDLIHEVITLMNFGGTVEQMKAVIHAHPTLSEVLQSAYNA